MNTYELIPTNGRKSFYGKATVTRDDNGTETLYSYGTKIMSRDTDGKYTRYYEKDPSKTTCSHILSFSGMHRADFLKVPTEQEREQEEEMER
jgi:hypothetical protein